MIKRPARALTDWLRHLHVGRFALLEFALVASAVLMRRYANALWKRGEASMKLGFDVVFDLGKDRANELLASGQAQYAKADLLEWLSWLPVLAIFAVAWVWFGARASQNPHRTLSE